MQIISKSVAAVFPASSKWAFTTRRADRADVADLNPNVEYAVAGDLVLCEIIEINQHRRLQLAERRAAESYLGDHIVVCVGDRYAPDQFEGRAVISSDHADLIAGGGIVGTVEAAHTAMSLPTQVRPIGLLTDARGEVINISRYALPAATVPDHVTVIGVLGASMNSGKTTAAVSLAHGLKRAGFSVAGVKATGTGAFGDFNAFEDAGVPALDFTDAGMPTTYRMPLDRVQQGFETLVGTAAKRGAEIIVVEIADGVFQSETAAILRRCEIRDRFDGVVFAAPDALSALGGVQVLSRFGLHPFAVSGLVTRSPLAVREAEAATGIRHVTRDELRDPVTVLGLAGSVLRTDRIEATIAA